MLWNVYEISYDIMISLIAPISSLSLIGISTTKPPQLVRSLPYDETAKRNVLCPEDVTVMGENITALPQLLHSADPGDSLTKMLKKISLHRKKKTITHIFETRVCAAFSI